MMLHIGSYREGLAVFKALGSSTRLSILELLLDKGPMRMTSIAQELKITGGALTTHIKLLQESGIVNVEAVGGRHGIQKICYVNNQRILVESPFCRKGINCYETQTALGAYSAFEVSAPCGIALKKRVLNPINDPEAFALPEHQDACVLWFRQGYVEYKALNVAPKGEKLRELQFSFEVGIEAPAALENASSDITISLNGREIGVYTPLAGVKRIPVSGNPAWWNRNWLQRGDRKLLTVDEHGSALDGEVFSAVSLKDLNLGADEYVTLRLEVKPDAQNLNGLSLFGSGFGKRRDGIVARFLTPFKEI